MKINVDSFDVKKEDIDDPSPKKVKLLEKVIRCVDYIGMTEDCRIPLGFLFNVNEEDYNKNIYRLSSLELKELKPHRLDPIDDKYLETCGDKDLYKPIEYYKAMDEALEESKVFNEYLNSFLSSIKFDENDAKYDITVSIKGAKEKLEEKETGWGINAIFNVITRITKELLYDEDEAEYVSTIDLIKYLIKNHMDIDLVLEASKEKKTLFGKKIVPLGTKRISYVYSYYFKGLLNEKIPCAKYINPIIECYKDNIEAVRDKFIELSCMLDYIRNFTESTFNAIPKEYHTVESLSLLLKVLNDNMAGSIKDALPYLKEMEAEEEAYDLIMDLEDSLAGDYPDIIELDNYFIEDLRTDIIDIDDLMDEDDFVFEFVDFEFSAELEEE